MLFALAAAGLRPAAEQRAKRELEPRQERSTVERVVDQQGAEASRGGVHLDRAGLRVDLPDEGGSGLEVLLTFAGQLLRGVRPADDLDRQVRDDAADRVLL